MPETENGIDYPDAAGHTRLWEHLQALGESADVAMRTLDGELLDALFGAGVRPHIEWGTVTVAANNESNASKAVTFARPFAAAPVVFVTWRSGNFGWIPGANAITVNGFTAQIAQRDNQATTSSTPLSWIAVGV